MFNEAICIIWQTPKTTLIVVGRRQIASPAYYGGRTKPKRGASAMANTAVTSVATIRAKLHPQQQQGQPTVGADMSASREERLCALAASSGGLVVLLQRQPDLWGILEQAGRQGFAERIIQTDPTVNGCGRRGQGLSILGKLLAACGSSCPTRSGIQGGTSG